MEENIVRFFSLQNADENVWLLEKIFKSGIDKVHKGKLHNSYSAEDY